jgi:hypothetical protein
MNLCLSSLDERKDMAYFKKYSMRGESDIFPMLKKRADITAMCLNGGAYCRVNLSEKTNLLYTREGFHRADTNPAIEE